MDYTSLNDSELMDLIRARDEKAFDALRLRYMRPIRRHLISVVHDADLADDLFQETCLQVWLKADQWERRGSFKSWLFRIEINLALNALRTKSRKKEIPLEAGPAPDEDDYSVPGWMVDSITPGPEAALEQAERRTMLRELVNGLPEEKRELIRLVYEAGMELKEAAKALGIPEGTAKSRLHYSTRRLAQEWRNLENE